MSNRHAHLDWREKTGKKPQAVSIAPKPESAPRMTVPMTVSRESVEASTLCAGMPAGSGTYESARRKRKFGMRYSSRPMESVRCRADGTECVAFEVSTDYG